MSRGEDIALKAMKKELLILTRKANRAKAEADEALHIGREMLSIHKEFVVIVKSKEHSKQSIDKLAALSKRSSRAEKIQKKSLIKLFDKEHQASFDRDDLASEISMIEFRQQLRKGKF